MYGVIMAGGRGKRFWPLSRAEKPKQFLDLTGEGSMLRLTYRRLIQFIPPRNILVLTVKNQFSSVSRELPEVPSGNIYLEPVGRNTAPSLALASAAILSRGEDEPALCCPSDHIIEDSEEFVHLSRAACRLAGESDILVTFGIPPDRPATGYGYIQGGNKIARKGERDFLKAVKFHEKPDRETAESYIDSESFYWNSGIFVWRPSVFLDSWRRFMPEAVETLEAIAKKLGSPDESTVIEKEYPGFPSLSVDYAIMEKAGNVVVAPADVGWNDVGSWDALFEILPRDENGNIIRGQAEFMDSRGNLVFNQEGFSAVIGVEDLIVIFRDGLLLVCRRGDSEKVKQMVGMVEERGSNEFL